jgi:hypothetical protein
MTFKPAGVAVAAVMAGIVAPTGVLQAAEQAMAAREAEADALAAAAMRAGAAEPLGEDAVAQGNLFDL